MNRGEQDRADQPKAVYAAAYVIGAVDAFSLGNAVCLHGVSANQIDQIVLNYLNAHPDEWNGSASKVIWNAVRAQYGCPKKGS